MSRVMVIISVLVTCITVCLSWVVSNYHDGTTVYEVQRDKATSIVADMQKHQRNVAELGARYAEEFADANTIVKSLRTDVSAGHKRLQVAAIYTKSVIGANDMGNGESPKFAASVGLRYYRFRSGINKITSQIDYLREYIRTQYLN